jgi:hypothetical protein
LHRAKRVEAGLTEEVGRRWGGGERPARRRSDGGRLQQGGGILEGSPMARDIVEGGDCERGIRAEKKTWHGGEKSRRRR